MNAARPLFTNTKWEHQMELERLYDKNQLMRRIRGAFKECEEINFAELFQRAEIPEDFGIDLLAHMAVHKRATVPTMVGCLRHHCESDQAAAALLEKAVNARFLEYWAQDKVLVVRFEISEELQAELERFQFPLPMVVPPAKLQSNLDTGYLTGRGSVLLKDNHHDDDVCLDHLNRLNQTKLALNLEVAQTIQNKWKKLDRKKVSETLDEYRQRRRAFEKYDRVAKDIINLLLKEGNELYLTHKYDFRGRTYCTGFHITYQGTDWNKAVIEFADKEVVND